MLHRDYYSEGAIVLALLSLGQLVNVWAGSCTITLMMTGQQNALFFISLICSIGGVAGYLLLVPTYGAVGAAIIAMSVLILRNALSVFYVKSRCNMRVYMDLASIRALRNG